MSVLLVGMGDCLIATAPRFKPSFPLSVCPAKAHWCPVKSHLSSSRTAEPKPKHVQCNRWARNRSNMSLFSAIISHSRHRSASSFSPAARQDDGLGYLIMHATFERSRPHSRSVSPAKSGDAIRCSVSNKNCAEASNLTTGNVDGLTSHIVGVA